MRTRTKYLLGILTLIFAVGLAIEVGTTTDDIKRLAVATSVILWVVALVGLLSRRDIDIHDKLSWVVAILLLNGIGALLYFVFGPVRQTDNSQPPTIDPNAQPISPEGESWNPILGANRMAEGEGLNPRDKGVTEPEIEPYPDGRADAPAGSS